MSHFDLTARRYKIQELTAKTLEESFWNDPQKAQVVIRQLNATKDVVDSYDALQKALSSLDETQELLKEDFDEEIFELFELEYQENGKNFADFEIKVLLSHEYDHSSAILELHPGAGGTDPVIGQICCIACTLAGRKSTNLKSVCWIISRGMKPV